MSAPVSLLARWRADRTIAHIAPLVIFQIIMLLVQTGKNNPVYPWYVRAPEQWVYPLQTIVCGTLILWWWKQYQFRWPDFGQVLVAVVVGLAGIALWILPCEVFYRGGFTAESAGALKFLGVQERELGFDPSDAPCPIAAIILRFLRMVVVVAILEEIFWRGFLMRWLVDMEKPVWSIPFGTHHWRALVGSVAGVVLVHQPADYLAAFFWGLLLYFLAVQTKSLVACIIAHGVANLVLGIYVMQTGRLGFW